MRSGTGTAAVEKAQKAYEEYKFFHWYDEFQQARKVTTNTVSFGSAEQKSQDIKESTDSSSDEEIDVVDDEGEEKDHNEADSSDNGLTYDGLTDDTVDNNENRKEKEKNKSTAKVIQFTKPKAKRMRKREIENKTDVLIGDLAKSIKNRRLATKTEKDSEDLFASSIAMEIRKMPDQIKCMVKNEINQVLFKYQMLMFNNSYQSSILGNPTLPHVLPGANYFMNVSQSAPRSDTSSPFMSDMSFYRGQANYPSTITSPTNVTPPSTPSNITSPSQTGEVYTNMTSPSPPY